MVFGFFYKPKSNGIDSNLFKLIELVLNNRWQRIVPNGQSSVWKSVTAVVPQGSVLVSLFILIYINDLHYNLQFTLHYLQNIASVSASSLNNDLVKIRD